MCYLQCVAIGYVDGVVGCNLWSASRRSGSKSLKRSLEWHWNYGGGSLVPSRGMGCRTRRARGRPSQTDIKPVEQKQRILCEDGEYATPTPCSSVVSLVSNDIDCRTRKLAVGRIEAVSGDEKSRWQDMNIFVCYSGGWARLLTKSPVVRI